MVDRLGGSPRRILFSQGSCDITSSKVNLQLGLGKHVLIVGCPTPFTDQVKADKFYEGHDEFRSLPKITVRVVSTQVVNPFLEKVFFLFFFFK